MKFCTLFPILYATLLAACVVDEPLDIATGDGEQGLYVDDQVLWSQPEITVCWEDALNGAAYTTEKQWVRDMMTGPESWSAYADIRFVGWQDCTGTEPGIHITPSASMASQLGDRGVTSMWLDFMGASPQTWWTRCATNNLSRQRCIEVVAVHEFGHALGFAHEHNRPDTPSACTAAPQGSNGTVTYGAWDGDSIMNYCSSATVLSETDIAGVRAFYGAPRPWLIPAVDLIL